MLRASEIFNIQGKLIFISGASSGLGLAMAEFLSHNGATCILVARRKDELGEFQKKFPQTKILAADLAKIAQIPDIIAQIIHEFGLPDVIINNAGTVGRAKALDTSLEEWQSVMELNANSLRIVSTQFAKYAIERQQGLKIINIASTMAFRGIAKGSVSYCASKAVVARLTEVMAYEWGQYNIQVNAICPGFIKTDLNRDYLEQSGREKILLENLPLRRLGKSDDIMGLILLLSSPASDWITGANYIIDGGQALCGI